MRFVKLAFISTICLFILATLMGLLFPATVNVSRVVDINISKDNITPLVLKITEWKKWLPNASDTSFKIINNQNNKVGTKLLIGSNEVTVTSVTNNTITTIWKGKNGQKMESFMQVIGYTDKANICTVQWNFQQQLQWYPWERFASMMNDKILGPLMEQGLDNLRKKYAIQEEK